MKAKRFLSLSILSALCLNILSGCGGTDTPAQETSSGSSDTTANGATAEEYVYPDKTYGGYEFRVFNIHKMWDCYMNLDHESLTGDVVDDAVYNRNRLVEQKLDIKLRQYRIILSAEMRRNFFVRQYKNLQAGYRPCQKFL